VNSAAATATVVMYSTNVCPYCDRARALLQRKGVHITEIKVDADSTELDIMMKRSGRRTVPQIFAGDYHIGGFDDLAALERKNELDAILAANAVTAASN
jgi:glutaredoxin 3